MHIQQISDARDLLESKIEAAINSFVQKTGIRLTDIKSAEVTGWDDEPTKAKVTIDVQIDLPRP